MFISQRGPKTQPSIVLYAHGTSNTIYVDTQSIVLFAAC